MEREYEYVHDPLCAPLYKYVTSWYGARKRHALQVIRQSSHAREQLEAGDEIEKRVHARHGHLGLHRRRGLLLPFLRPERRRGAQQDVPARRECHVFPRGKGPLRGGDGGATVFRGCGGGRRCEGARVRAMDMESRACAGGAALAIDEKRGERDVGHDAGLEGMRM